MFKKLLIALSIALISFSSTANEILYSFKVLKIIDGDTIKIEANFLPKPLKPELNLRIYGIDTPEKGFRAKCEEENRKGVESTKYVQSLISTSSDIKISLREWDKYGGRVLGDIYINNTSLRQLLIKKGYAREYYGTAKESWCK